MFVKDVIEAMIQPKGGTAPGAPADNSKPFDASTPPAPNTNNPKTIKLSTAKDGKTLIGMTPQDQAMVTNVLGNKPLAKIDPNGQDATSNIMQMAKAKGYDVQFADNQQQTQEAMPSSVIKHKQKYSNMSDEEKKSALAGKSIEFLKSMARRHGYGPDSDVYSKYHDGLTGNDEKKVELQESTDIARIKQLAGLSIL